MLGAERRTQVEDTVLVSADPVKIRVGSMRASGPEQIDGRGHRVGHPRGIASGRTRRLTPCAFVPLPQTHAAT